MPKEEIIVGLDIGSQKIKTVVGQKVEEDEKPHIIGIGEAEAQGIRRGIIVDIEEAVSSISASLEKAERMTGIPVEKAYVAIDGSHVTSQTSKGVIAVSRADGEITEDDVARVIDAAQAVSVPSNHEILHIIPRTFSVDNQDKVKDPVGMNGVRLEVEALIIEGSTSFIKNLTKAVYRTGVDVEDLVLAPLASGTAVLTKRQKELGVVLVDIGEGTTGVAVFEEGDLLHTSILPIGAGYITNDIAIGLRTSVEVAEKVKLEYGYAVPAEVDKKEEIDLSKLEKNEEETISRFHIAEIIEARLSEIFSMVDGELQKIDRSGMLPAGAVLTGGGAKMPGIVDVAKEDLRLPAQVGFPQEMPVSVDKIDDPLYATPVGLVLWGADVAKRLDRRGFLTGLAKSETVGKMKKWFKSFLP